MPNYKVSRRRRRPTFGRKFFNTADRALKTALHVKKLLNVEYKVTDIVETTQAVDSSGVLISLNNNAQGNGAQQRSGNSVLNKTLQLKYYCTQHASATNTFVRLVLLLDKSPNGTVTTINDIFSETRITGHLDIEHMHRYRILSEQLISLNASSHDNVIGKKFHQLKFHTKYEGSDSTENGIEKNQLLLYMISNEATNTPSVHYSTRLRFIDN